MKINVLLLIFVSFPFLVFTQQEKDSTIERIKKISSASIRAKAYDDAAINSWQTGEYEQAIRYANKGLEICKDHDLSQEKAMLLNDRGVAYDFLGKNSLALNSFFEALRIQETLDKPSYEAYILGNIGLIYDNQNFLDKSLIYHKKSLKIRRKINEESGISASINNIANIYHQWKQFDKAIDSYLECIEIDTRLKDTFALGDDYNNIGNSYMGQEQFDLALDYYHKSLEIRKEMNSPYLLAQIIANIGTVHFNKEEYDQARPFLIRSLEIADSISGRDLQLSLLNLIYRLEEKCGNINEAYTYYKAYSKVKENSDNAQDLVNQTELELQYEFDKQKEKDAIIQEKKDAQEKLILYGISAVLIIIVFFSMLLFRRWKQTQLQKTIIEEKNKLVQQKNQEITDSITYAKRIQTAILPSEKLMKELLHTHYLIYLPKDIVAGDFYWLEEINGRRFVAVADCTGHGVPGALMSVVCHNALNRSVREYNLKNPGEILDKTREIILSELSKSNTVVNDGMDISICSFEPKSNQLFWAGANNSLLIYRHEKSELEEVRADKQPIGNHWNYEPFTTHEISLNPLDRIFLYTDGFADQFGGPKGKKLKSTGLKEELIHIQQLPMLERQNALIAFFMRWKGNLDQLDDVCLLSFSVL